MSVPEKIPLSELSRGDLEALTERLLAENAALKQVVADLRAGIVRLKGVTGGPAIRPSGMEQKTDVVRNPGMVSFVIDIGDPAVLQIGSIIWIVRDSQSPREELVGIRHIAERQCDGSFKRRR